MRPGRTRISRLLARYRLLHGLPPVSWFPPCSRIESSAHTAGGFRPRIFSSRARPWRDPTSSSPATSGTMTAYRGPWCTNSCGRLIGAPPSLRTFEDWLRRSAAAPGGEADEEPRIRRTAEGVCEAREGRSLPAAEAGLPSRTSGRREMASRTSMLCRGSRSRNNKICHSNAIVVGCTAWKTSKRK